MKETERPWDYGIPASVPPTPTDGDWRLVGYLGSFERCIVTGRQQYEFFGRPEGRMKWVLPGMALALDRRPDFRLTEYWVGREYAIFASSLWDEAGVEVKLDGRRRLQHAPVEEFPEIQWDGLPPPPPPPGVRLYGREVVGKPVQRLWWEGRLSWSDPDWPLGDEAVRLPCTGWKLA